MGIKLQEPRDVLGQAGRQALIYKLNTLSELEA
jgi:hypothetical protein